jgi:hypothetical protein
LAVVAGVIGFLFALGAGIYVLKNAREMGETGYRASGEIFNLGFWIWIGRIAGILAIGLSGFMLYAIINSLFFS